MLKLGEKSIKSVYLGERGISKAYLGEKLVFSAKKPSRLPEGYTELKYIDAGTDKPYISSISPIVWGDMRIVIEAEPLTLYPYGSSINQCPILTSMYQRNSGSNTYYTYLNMLFRETADGNSINVQISNDRNGVTFNSTFSVDGKTSKIKIDFDWNSKEVKINDGPPTTINSGWSTSYKTSLNLPAKKTYTNGVFSVRIYSYKYYRTDILKNDFVPCTNPSGIVGMYDLVGEKFLASSNTAASFIAGPPV